MLRGYKCLINRKILDIIIKRGLVKAPGCFYQKLLYMPMFWFEARGWLKRPVVGRAEALSWLAL